MNTFFTNSVKKCVFILRRGLYALPQRTQAVDKVLNQLLCWYLQEVKFLCKQYLFWI